MVSDTDEGFYWFIIFFDVILIVLYSYYFKKHGLTNSGRNDGRDGGRNTIRNVIRERDECLCLNMLCLALYILFIAISLIAYFSSNSDNDMRIAFYSACMPLIITAFLIVSLLFMIAFAICVGATTYYCFPLCMSLRHQCRSCCSSGNPDSCCAVIKRNLTMWWRNCLRAWARILGRNANPNFVDFDDDEHYPL